MRIVIAGREVLADPEIGQFQVVIPADHEQIRRLQVRVNDPLLMDDVERQTDLNEELPCALLSQINQCIVVRLDFRVG